MTEALTNFYNENIAIKPKLILSGISVIRRFEGVASSDQFG